MPIENNNISQKINNMLETTDFKAVLSEEEKVIEKVKKAYEKIDNWEQYKKRVQTYYISNEYSNESYKSNIFENFLQDNFSNTIKILNGKYTEPNKERELFIIRYGFRTSIETTLKDKNRKIKMIKVGRSGLSKFHKDELKDIFKNVSHNIKDINLEKSDIGKLGYDHIISIFTNLKSTLKNLNLSKNSLGTMETYYRDIIIKNLPCDLTSLNLGKNWGMKIDNEIIEKLPRNIKILNLEACTFDGIEEVQWGDNIEVLMIGYNNIGILYEKDIEQFFYNLPRNLKVLDLSNNKISQLDINVFKNKRISNIKCIYLQDNGFSIKQKEEIKKILKNTKVIF